MVVITMEAHVPEDQWDTLVRAFDEAMQDRPADILLSVLMHDSLDSTLWRVITVWESQEALEAYYDSHATMPSAYAFHLANVVPEATLSEVAAYV